ncbi:Melanoma-associated antigen B4 [Apodemus speciosus]|uniref:Melanoma-associated antigen B4 n=1 Tax=Apodemus speciosus TaxID=105296 RepID=A0ABQ0FUM8_APOSI
MMEVGAVIWVFLLRAEGGLALPKYVRSLRWGLHTSSLGISGSSSLKIWCKNTIPTVHSGSCSDPPSYEFLWGPRAYAETSQVKVVEFLAKINENMPGAYSSRYEQALIEEEEQAKAAAKAGTKGKAKGHSKSKLSNPPR